MFDGKSILITGGTGSFGKTFIRMVLQNYSPEKLIIYSRDELKQYELMNVKSLKNSPLRYFLGDVRDQDRLRRAMKGVDLVVHAAAYKHVPAAEYNPFEFVKTNINGAQNVIEAALDAGVEKVVALSTDKACNPINLYGATKLASDKMFVAANAYGGFGTCFSIVRYGNVVGSRGSAIPFFLKQKTKGLVTLTDPEMTRFWITLKDAVNMVWDAFDSANGGEIFIPKIPTMCITDLIEVLAPGVPVKNIGIRPGEKLHECMISEDDSRYAYDFEKYYAILPAIDDKYKDPSINRNFSSVEKNFRYSSETNPERMSQDMLKSILASYHTKGNELVHEDDVSFYDIEI